MKTSIMRIRRNWIFRTATPRSSSLGLYCVGGYYVYYVSINMNRYCLLKRTTHVKMGSPGTKQILPIYGTPQNITNVPTFKNVSHSL